jgi:hypothetical protein
MPMDATDKEAHVPRSRGCSVVVLYNHRRPHQALNNKMPMAVWRDGIEAIEAAHTAVDKPLGLDNAHASATYLQPYDKQQEAA